MSMCGASMIDAGGLAICALITWTVAAVLCALTGQGQRFLLGTGWGYMSLAVLLWLFGAG